MGAVITRSGVQNWGRDCSIGVQVIKEGFPEEALGRQKGASTCSSDTGLWTCRVW